MTHAELLLEHPPAMAEMAGALLDNESHAHSPVEHAAAESVPAGLAALEAETES